jgi:hypothetical protein
MEPAQSCQQAIFFRPGLTWYDLRCLQAMPKIKDRSAAWPDLQAEPDRVMLMIFQIHYTL